MAKKKFFNRILAFAAALFVMTGCSKTEEATKPAAPTAEVPEVTGEFTFTALKVGKADALVLKTQNHTVLIDCGEKDDGDNIVEYLNENGIEKIDKLYITHFDKDHVGGAAEIIQNMDIDEIITPDYITDSKEYQSFLGAASEKGIIPQKIGGDNEYTAMYSLDDVIFNVYPPTENEYDESDNDYSIAVSAQHGTNRFLFTGDAEKVRLEELSGQLSGTFDVLKVPHHGGMEDNSEAFISQISPKYAVIACSEKNPADPELVALLEQYGAQVYTTAEANVGFTSDGQSITVSQ